MEITVNGDGLATKAATVGELLGELRILPERVAVEVNLAVISKKDYGSFGLRDGDRVEIVNFVGGG